MEKKLETVIKYYKNGSLFSKHTIQNDKIWVQQ